MILGVTQLLPWTTIALTFFALGLFVFLGENFMSDKVFKTYTEQRKILE